MRKIGLSMHRPASLQQAVSPAFGFILLVHQA
jgi:hypothetical protein